MTFQVRMLLLTDTFDDYRAADSPNEVHIRWMNHHAVFVGGIEAD